WWESSYSECSSESGCSEWWVEGTGNGNQSGATIAEDWVTLLGIAQPDQGDGMLLIFKLSCSLLKRKKQGFNFKQKNLTSWLLQGI
nr:hypothetical protein [Tanacetum cinerariifolium]